MSDDPEYMKSTIKKYQFTIPLKPGDPNTEFPRNFNQRIAIQYASMYLDKLGAEPTDENISLVAENYPLDRCAVSTSMKTRGLTDVVTINTAPMIREIPEIESIRKNKSRLYIFLITIIII